MFRAAARFRLPGSAGPRASARSSYAARQRTTRAAACLYAPVRSLRLTTEYAPPPRQCALLRANTPGRLCALLRAQRTPHDAARFCALLTASSSLCFCARLCACAPVRLHAPERPCAFQCGAARLQAFRASALGASRHCALPSACLRNILARARLRAPKRRACARLRALVRRFACASAT